MPLAARVGDPCKESIPSAPKSVEGTGHETVFIEDKPAAYADKQIVKGSKSVFVNDKPLARVGDQTRTGGVVQGDCESVEVG